jgi:long-chain acyl-CoA synthetase
MLDQPQTIVEAFRKQVRQRGEQSAILGASEPWSFSRLDRASDSVAVGLADRGLGVGDRVGLYCLNVPEFVVSYLGILKAGATIVPINLMLNPLAIAYMLEDAGAKGLFYHAQFAEPAAQVVAAVSGLSCVVCIDGAAEGADIQLDELLRSAGTPPAVRVDPVDDLAAILYTSGTTGKPKGAMLSHCNLVSNTNSVMQALNFEPGKDRILVVLPMFHAFAATVGVLTPLIHGLTMVALTRFEPRLVSDAVEEHGVTVFLGVPSMFSLLLRIDDNAVRQWRSVWACVSGGAAMPKAVMEAFVERFQIPVLEGDGPTECSPVTCVNPPAGPHKAGSVGPPLPGIDMRIVNPQGGTLGDGEHGEVCVRGPNVMRGYWGLEEATRESFFGEWFRTGDLGYRDGDGYFYLVDRIKDLIITNGMNVYPRIIEECLYRHPDVAEAAVVGEPHNLHGEIPIAYVAAKPDVEADVIALRDWCKQHLGRHEVPRRVVLVDALPRNAAGKVLKRELRREGEIERGVDHLRKD